MYKKNRNYCADLLTKARKVADTGDFGDARRQLQDGISFLKESPSGKSPETVVMIKDLQDAHDLMQEKHSYLNVGQKKMQMQEQSHVNQRANVLLSNCSPSMQLNCQQMEMQTRATAQKVSLKDDRYERRQKAQELPRSTYSLSSPPQQQQQEQQQQIPSQLFQMPQQQQQQVPSQLSSPKQKQQRLSPRLQMNNNAGSK